MKHTLLSLLALFLLLCQVFTIPCLAAQSIPLPSENMTLQLPDDFKVITKENLTQNQAFLEEYNVPFTETDVKFKEQNYLLLGLSQTMRCTLFLSKQTDSVSATIGDLISYDNPDLAKQLLLGESLPEQAVVKEIERNGALFYRVDFGVIETVGRIAYITVMNGTIYTLCVVDNSGTLTANTNAALDFTFERWDYVIHAEAGKIRAFQEQIITVIGWICIPLLVALGAFITVKIVREVRQRQMEQDRRRITPKKPRR